MPRSMPDRSSTVIGFYQTHPEYFVVDDPPGAHDSVRRQSLPALITWLHHVHPEDRDQWGVLVKEDRNLKIPCDVIVWAPTLEHVDISKADGGMWDPHDSIRVNGGDAWHWAPASVVAFDGRERATTAPPYPLPGDGDLPGTGGNGGSTPGGSSQGNGMDEVRDAIRALVDVSQMIAAKLASLEQQEHDRFAAIEKQLDVIETRVNVLDGSPTPVDGHISDALARIIDTLEVTGLTGRVDLPGRYLDGAVVDLKRKG